MSTSEFPRPIKLRAIPEKPVELEASEQERAALAHRFGIVGIKRLVASVALEPRGRDIVATGELEADLVQACAISGESFSHTLEEPIAFRFVPTGPAPADEDMEIELEADDLDEIDYEGDVFDLGEAVAQTLGLAIDPYAEGPNADAARKEAGITSDDAPSGPLAAALAALKKD